VGERTPKQAVAWWARDHLGHYSSDSPRCPKYPECGGEDGHGALLHGDGKRRIAARSAWDKRTEATAAEIVAKAPRCRDCAKYARAVTRLLDRLERESDVD
jgi:hypothetical protein